MPAPVSTFHITNFGCRATLADAAAIEYALRSRGLARAEDARRAELVVINTCTVTSDADATARQAIRRAHRENPSAHIVVTGCYAQRAPEELAQMEGVTLVVGNSHLTEIAGLIEYPASRAFLPVQVLAQGHANSPAHTPARIVSGDIFEAKTLAWDPVGGAAGDLTRPVLKIQDGCNSRCAYCVIPFVRGRSRSLSPDAVLLEIRRLVATGAKEIVLSGINLGGYGRDLHPRAALGGLLRRVLDETSLDRLRLSSIEPMDVTDDLVRLFADSGGRLAPHFHVPLQSGSDRILAAMHRWYRAAHYGRRIELIRELLPGAGIGADVIAGFPGETENDHAATTQLIEALPFTYLHVFSYSTRPGTEAARLIAEDRVVPVSPRMIKQRTGELRALGAEKSAAFRAAQSGIPQRVLTLRRRHSDASGLWTEALSGNFLTLRLPGHLEPNEWKTAAL